MRLSMVFGFAVAAALLLSTSMAAAASEGKPQFQWQRPKAIGNAPTGRHGNSATLIGNEMFVIGGCENDISCFSDISLYNTDSQRWEIIYSDREHARISPLHRENNIVIPPRGYHTATAVKSAAANNGGKDLAKIYVFGGHSADGFRSDLFILDPVSKAWSKPLIAGTTPSERSGHSAALYQDRILVFGGNSEDGFLNDLWQYDTKLNAWTKLNTKGVAVPTMGYHTASIVGKYMWVIGGRNDQEVLGKDIYVLDLELLTWSKPLIRGMGPSRRYGANAAVRQGRYIFVTGGCDISIGKCYDDQFILDTEQQTWVRSMTKFTPVVDTSVVKSAEVLKNSTKPTRAFAAKGKFARGRGGKGPFAGRGPAGKAGKGGKGRSMAVKPRVGKSAPARGAGPRGAVARGAPARANAAPKGRRGPAATAFLELEESIEATAEMDVDADAEATFDAEAEEEMEVDVDAEAEEEAEEEVEEEADADVEAEADAEIDAEEEASFLELNTDVASSLSPSPHGIMRKGNTLFLSSGADLDAYFSSQRSIFSPKKSSHVLAHENKHGEQSFADAAPAPVPAPAAAPAPAPVTPATPAATPAPTTPATPSPAVAPAVANATIAVVNTTAPVATPMVNATAVNVIAPVQNATAPVANTTLTMTNILQQSNITIPAAVANTTDIAPAHTVNNATLPKILGLKHIVDAAIAKKQMKADVEKEHKETQDRIKAATAVSILKNHAGSDFVGSFNEAGDKLFLFGGCGIMDVKCGDGVLVMHVEPNTQFQIGLF